MANINVYTKPLNKGMFLNVAPNEIPKGGFVDVDGMVVEDGSLRHRNFWQRARTYSISYTDSDDFVVDTAQFPLSTTTTEQFVITRKSLYKDTGSAFTAQSIAGSTTPFDYDPTCGIQHTIGQDSSGTAMWVTDGTNPLRKYDGTNWTTPTYAGVSTTSPRSVRYHDSRLWIGGPTTSNGSTLIFSDLRDPDVISATSEMVFAERKLPITRIETLGRFLVIFFPDAVYVGQASGDPYLPYVFSETNMSNVGLVGPRAYTQWKNGFFVISSNGTFWLRPDRVMEQIPCNVWGLIQPLVPKGGQFSVITAGNRENLYVGLPGNTWNTETILHYSDVDEAWTKWSTAQDALCPYIELSRLKWDNGALNPAIPASGEFELPTGIVPTWADFADYTIDSWDDLSIFRFPFTIVTFREGAMYILSSYISRDQWNPVGTRTISTLTFGDFDFGDPDTMKTFHRLGLRTDIDYATYNVLFKLEASNDGGQTWSLMFENISTADIEEAFAHFTFTGAETRFRLTFSSLSRPYHISDINFRVRTRGLETD